MHDPCSWFPALKRYVLSIKITRHCVEASFRRIVSLMSFNILDENYFLCLCIQVTSFEHRISTHWPAVFRYTVLGALAGSLLPSFFTGSLTRDGAFAALSICSFVASAVAARYRTISHVSISLPGRVITLRVPNDDQLLLFEKLFDLKLRSLL